MTGQPGRRAQSARRRPGADHGQATVELVLILPVVVLLALAVVQVGLVVRDRLLAAHAAREGARAAAVDPDPDAAASAARSATGLDPARLLVEVGGGSGPGDRVEITVVYRSVTEVPLVGALLPDLTVRSSLTARVE